MQELLEMVANQGFAIVAAVGIFCAMMRQMADNRTQIQEINEQHAKQIAEMNQKHQDELSAVLKQISANTRILNKLVEKVDALQ